MATQILRSGFSLLLLLLLASAAFAQEPELEEEDTIPARVKKPDSLREKFKLRSVRIGTDVLALILTGSDRFNGWEANTDVDFGKFYLSGDYGAWSKAEKLATGGDYSNDGSYWRAGLDINLLKKDPDRNMLFFGLRFAQSSFSETLNFESSDSLFGSLQYQLRNPAAKAAWFELVGGLKIKVWKELWLGFTSRMKFGLGVAGDDAFSSYDVPGYGLAGDGMTWGFNYQIFWRIPLEKKKKPISLPRP